MPSKEEVINNIKDEMQQTILDREKEVLDYELRLREAYEDAQSKIKESIVLFYGKYAKDNKITMLEAKKRLTSNELKEFKKKIKLYYNIAGDLDLDALSPDYVNKLDKLSSMAYVSRLEDLLIQIESQLEKLYALEVVDGEKVLKQGYTNSYYKSTYDIQKAIGFGIAFNGITSAQLDAAINAKYMDSSFSKSAMQRKEKIVKELDTILPQEFILGNGPVSVSKDLVKRTDISYRSAEMLIRTEMNSIANVANLAAYKDQGIEQYQYHATLDRRTSKICRSMDGKIFFVKDAKRGINFPPLHRRCRSTTVPVLSDYIEKTFREQGATRIARAKNGSTYDVPYNMTFEEWARAHVEDAKP